MYSEPATVLVVDDEPSVSDILYEDLTEEGYKCIKASTGEDALKRLSIDKFDALLLDLRLPGISGMDVLKEVRATCPETAVIVVTAAGDAQTAVEAMKNGAVDYMTKPFELEKVNSSVEATLKAKTVSRSRLTTEAERSKVSSKDAGWIRCLGDIAEGVATRLDSLTGYVMSIAVIEQTIDAAHRLEVPEEYVEKWVDSRRKDIGRVKTLDLLLKKRI